MMTLSFFSNVNSQVKYAYREVMNHLGIPFRDSQDVKSVFAGDPKFELVVFPETSKMSDDEVNQILSQKHSIMLSADLCLRSKFVDSLRTLTGHSLSIVGRAGSDPPRISGFLKLGTSEQIPFFFKFLRIQTNSETIVRSEIVDLDRVCSSGVCWYTLGSRVIIFYTPQIFNTIAYLLCGSEASFPLFKQQEMDLLDARRNIVGRNTELAKRGLLEIPVVNMYENIFTEILTDVAKIKQIPLIQKWLYPEAKRMCLCLTHDVDRFRRSHADLKREGFAAFYERNLIRAIFYFLLSFLVISPRLQTPSSKIYRTSVGKKLIETMKKKSGIGPIRFTIGYLIDQLRDIERRFDASSTFFFLSNLTINGSDYSFHDKEIKYLMASLLEQDCEVGLHAGCRNDRSVRIEKRDLEKAIGREIIGVRHHILHLSTPFGWRDQVNAGMNYDSSFGYDSDVGFKASCCLPFQPFDHIASSVLPILEIPPIIQDWTLHFMHGLDMASGDAFHRCAKIIKRTYELRGVLTVIWHPHYDDKLYPGWNYTYWKILELCSHLRAWYASAGELAKWWNRRNAVHLSRCDWDGQTLSLLLTSHLAVPDFCMRISLPLGIIPGKVDADRGKATPIIDRDDFFVCIDIAPGDTKLNIETLMR